MAFPLVRRKITVQPATQVDTVYSEQASFEGAVSLVDGFDETPPLAVQAGIPLLQGAIADILEALPHHEQKHIRRFSRAKAIVTILPRIGDLTVRILSDARQPHAFGRIVFPLQSLAENAGTSRIATTLNVLDATGINFLTMVGSGEELYIADLVRIGIQPRPRATLARACLNDTALLWLFERAGSFLSGEHGTYVPGFYWPGDSNIRAQASYDFLWRCFFFEASIHDDPDEMPVRILTGSFLPQGEVAEYISAEAAAASFLSITGGPKLAVVPPRRSAG